MNTGAFGEGFPYSNFHDINMDWIIKIAKDFLDQYTHIQDTITQGLTDLQDKADTLEGLLQAWYDTHSADIANQLADALQDLNDWYNEHIDDIDDELQDALSELNSTITTKFTQFSSDVDSKVASAIASIPSDYSTLSADAFQNLGHLPTELALNDIATNSVYQVYSNDNPTNYPLGNNAGIIITNIVYSPSIRTQYCIPFNPPPRNIYYRKLSGGSWTSWTDIYADIYINNGSFSGNLNAVTSNCVLQVAGSNSPGNYPSELSGSSGIVITNQFSGSSFLTQMAIGYSVPIICTRYYNGSWSDWLTVYNKYSTYVNHGLVATGENINNLTRNGIYHCQNNGSYVNYPFGDFSGIIITTVFYTNIFVQIALPYNLDINKNSYYVIRHYSGSSWSAWQYARFTIRNKDAKYYAFGDSVAYGYSSDHDNAQSPYNYPHLIENLIDVKTYNKAVAGQGIIKNWDTASGSIPAIISTINSMISNHEFDNTVLVTVNWAYNDVSEYANVNFGSPTDPVPQSDTGITTYLGYYARILAKLQSACPNAQVILITGYGRKTGTPAQITQTFLDGNKTEKQMYDALEEMANYNGFQCINQAKGTVLNAYNKDTIIEDNIHPTYDGYKLYGNFIAGKVVSMFQNVST